jgi:hypothetical protein
MVFSGYWGGRMGEELPDAEDAKVTQRTQKKTKREDKIETKKMNRHVRYC